MAHTKTRLPIVKTPDAQAGVLSPTAPPAFVGDGQDDLLCGDCGVVLGSGISIDTIRDKFVTPTQLLIKCPECGAHNCLPDKVDN